jgi:hypothetical protein
MAAKMKPLTPDDPRHGTINAYVNYGCRCPECKGARRDYGRNLRDRHIEAAAALRQAS